MFGNKRILIPFLIVLTNQVGAGSLLPVLSVYVEEEMGATTIETMMVVAAFYIAQFIAAPWLGGLSDRYGRRPVLIVSQVGTVLACIIIYFAIPLGGIVDQSPFSIGLSGSLLIMFAARILDGATGGNISVAQAYVSDVSEPQNRAQALGLIGGATGLGYVLGPVLGGALSLFGFLVPFLGATAITTLTLLLTLAFLQEPTQRLQKSPQPTSEHAFANRTRLLIMSITFVSISAFSALQTIFPLYGVNEIFAAESMPMSPILMVGAMLTFISLVIAVGQIWLIKPLTARLGEPNVVTIGNVGMSIGALIVGLSQSPLAVLIGFIPFGIGYAITLTCLQSLNSLTGGRQMQGQLMGWLQAAISLAYISGPIWAGIVYSRVGPQTPFVLAAGLFGCAFLLCLRLRTPRPFARLSVNPSSRLLTYNRI